MKHVLHAKPTRLRCCAGPFGALAAALAVGLSVACAAALAADASAAFRISLQLVPETPGSCSANTNGGAPQVTCRPSQLGVASTAESNASRDPTVLRYRTDQGFRLAGEMIEVGNENYLAWVDRDNMAGGEYSSRLVLAGGREYVEMTVAW